MRLLLKFVFLTWMMASALVSKARAQKSPSPGAHPAQTIRADGIKYSRARLEHFEPNYVTLVHETGRLVVRWDSLEEAIQHEYTPEHNAAVEAAKPKTYATPAAAPTRTAVAPTLPTQEIRCADGTTYHNVAVLSVDPAFVTIRHRGGVARVSLATIQAEDRAKIAPNFDEGKAAAFAARDAEETRKAEAQQSAAQDQEALFAQLDSMSMFFSGKIIQITDNGALMEGAGATDDKYKRVKVNGEDTSIRTEQGDSTYYKMVFVAGLSDSSLVDGDHWSGRVWPAGRFRYTAVMGDARTVPRVATSRAAAIKLLSDR